MQIRTARSCRLVRAAAGVLLSVAAVACDDSTTGAGRGTNRQVEPLKPLSASAQGERSRLAKRNPNDWLGVAHNLILDDFRTELKKPGVLTRNVCGYMVDLVTRGDRLPVAQRSHAQHGIAAARSASGNLPLCKNRSEPGVGRFTSSAQAELTLSSEATAILEEIRVAVEGAPDAGSLATQLNQILDRSTGLSDPEREVVLSIVSVAQHSYDYWQASLPAFEQQLFDEYGSCARQQWAGGLSSDDARSACMEGGSPATISGPLNAPPLSSLSLSRARRDCGLTKSFKKLAGADVSGAISGALTGARTGGWAGVLPGALAGAAFTSLGSAIKITWDLFWCAMD